jgi:hypothetical protein
MLGIFQKSDTEIEEMEAKELRQAVLELRNAFKRTLEPVTLCQDLSISLGPEHRFVFFDATRIIEAARANGDPRPEMKQECVLPDPQTCPNLDYILKIVGPITREYAGQVMIRAASGRECFGHGNKPDSKYLLQHMGDGIWFKAHGGRWHVIGTY